MARNYHKLLDQILSHPGFRDWAMGESPEMDEFWRKWVDNDAVKRETLETAKRMVLSFHKDTPSVSDEQIQKKIQQAISTAQSYEQEVARKPEIPLRRVIWTVAASFLLILGLGGGYLMLSGKKGAQTAGVAESKYEQTGETRVFINDTPNARHILLSDGSSVILQPQSELSYPEQFQQDRREVQLIGEAFFEVVKNPHVPFYVRAQGTVAKVLGTSFRMKAKPGTHFLEVKVKSGRVAVLRNKLQGDFDLNNLPDDRFQLLKINEKIVFDLSRDELNTWEQTSESLARLPIELFTFAYESTPITRVFSDLEAAYGVHILYDPARFKGCSLTAELGDDPLPRKIQWICTILEAEYQISSDTITVFGSPCL